MSELPNFALLLKRIGVYLENATAEGTQEKKDLETARQAFNTIVDTLYGTEINRCTLHPITKPVQSGD